MDTLKRAIGSLTFSGSYLPEEPTPPGRPAAGSSESMEITGGKQVLPHLGVAGNISTGREAMVEWVNVDEIIKRKGWSAYSEMRHDAQIKACLRMKTALVSQRAFTVIPASDSERDKNIAKFVKAQLMNKRLFTNVVKDACQACTWGFNTAEVVWTMHRWEGQSMLGIKKVVSREPDRLTLDGDNHGNLMRIRQEPDRGGFIALPYRPGSIRNRIFHYAYQSEFGNPHGNSDLRSVYKNWWMKKYVLQFWGTFLDRMGSPLTVAKYPQGSSQPVRDAIKQILRNLQSKTDIMVPEGVEMELLEAKRAGSGDYDVALQYNDSEIAKGILVPSLLGMGQDIKRGSDSQSRLHLRTLFKVIGDLGDEIACEFFEQIVVSMVIANFGPDAGVPSLQWGDFGEFEGPELADVIRLLHSAGILEMDQEDINYARSLIGMRMRGDGDKEEEIVRPPQPPPPGNAGAPPPAAAQGNQQGAGKQSRTGSGGKTGGGAGSGKQS